MLKHHKKSVFLLYWSSAKVDMWHLEGFILFVSDWLFLDAAVLLIPGNGASCHTEKTSSGQCAQRYSSTALGTDWKSAKNRNKLISWQEMVIFWMCANFVDFVIKISKHGNEAFMSSLTFLLQPTSESQTLSFNWFNIFYMPLKLSCLQDSQPFLEQNSGLFPGQFLCNCNVLQAYT